MVMRLAFVFVLLTATVKAQAATVDLAVWAQHLPKNFVVEGSKVEPTYVAAIEIRRDGNVFSILGGAPAWMARSRETIEVDDHGTMRHLVCPKAMDCTDTPHPAGFLASAALIAAVREGTLSGMVQTEPYGLRHVVCIPGEKLGIRQPILDPCFDVQNGAAIAQKSRFSGHFDGPSLDPVTLHILPDDQKDSTL